MMWLTEKLNRNTETNLTEGEVGSSERLTITGESVHIAPQQVLPYGIASVPPAGEQAVMLSGLCVGVATVQDARLEPGELLLFSSGGAEIHLKNDGTVVINGQSFSRK